MGFRFCFGKDARTECFEQLDYRSAVSVANGLAATLTAIARWVTELCAAPVLGELVGSGRLPNRCFTGVRMTQADADSGRTVAQGRFSPVRSGRHEPTSSP